MKHLSLLLTILTLIACTNEHEARRVLELDGFTDVKITGYKFWACSKDDFYHTGFSAIKNKKDIDGVVCSGLLFKASTIRF